MIIRVIIVDDQPGLRAVVRTVLADDPVFEVVGEAGDGAEAIRLIDEVTPDIAIMDVAMPGMGGIEATGRLRDAGALARVIALSMHADRGYVQGMMTAGARGYVLKDRAAEELPEAMKTVHSGQVYLSPEIPKDIADAFQ